MIAWLKRNPVASALFAALATYAAYAWAADTKISGFADGSPCVETDEMVVARGSANNKLDLEDVVCVMDREATTVDIVSSTTETDIFSFTVPANTLDTSRALRLTCQGDYLNNNATTATLTLRVKFNAVVSYQDAVDASAISATRRPWTLSVVMAANNATNAQTFGGVWLLGTAGGATTGLGDMDTDELESVTPFSGTGTVDQTAARTFNVTAQLDVNAATFSFRRHWCGLERI
jgi:hypothetical protein